MEIVVCPPLAHVIRDLASRFNGGIVPEAITIADVTLFLKGKPSDALVRHEAKHREQWKRFRPWWMPLNPWRDRIAYLRFIAAYTKEHKENGYQGNKFELEALAAE